MRTESENSALYHQYERYFMSIAGGLKQVYYVRSMTRDDWDQVCRIGAWMAVNQWDVTKGHFEPFARVVITRLVISTVKAANKQCRAGSQREVQMNHLRERSDDNPDGEPRDFGEACEHLQGLEEQWAYEAVLSQLPDVLTEKQLRALQLKAEGCTYEEIKAHTGYGKKQIDNALYKARKKLRGGALAPRADP